MMEIHYDRYYWQDDLVRLRPVQEEDWQLAYVNMFDSHARRLLQYEVELPPSEKSLREDIARWVDFDQDTGRLMFTVQTLDDVAVGALNLNSIDEKNGTFSIGMQVGREFRGRGYGTAAMRILLRYAFWERRLNKYEGSILEGNTASKIMLEKLGCVREGVRRQSVYTDGRYMDTVLYGLTREEFEKASPCHNRTP